MKKWILASALLVIAFWSYAIPQSKDALIGTWKLVSATNTTAKGDIENAFGVNPTGFLTYTADDRMMAIITYRDRRPLSVDDRVAAPPQERAEAFATMLAYAGRYTFAGDKVTHHVEAASVQNWVNTDLVRAAKLQGNRLIIRTPPGALIGGVRIAGSELVWERVK